jgi:hypothetical protein
MLNVTNKLVFQWNKIYFISCKKNKNYQKKQQPIKKALIINALNLKQRYIDYM